MSSALVSVYPKGLAPLFARRFSFRYTRFTQSLSSKCIAFALLF
jgi:hypothetical protein